MKKITSTDVAKLAGVSQTAVSIALNQNTKVHLSDETRNKIIAAARELQYGPFSEKQMFPCLKNEIAVILPTISNPYYSMLLNAIEGIAFEKGYQINYCCTNKDPKKEKQILEQIDYGRTKCVIYTFTPQSRASAIKLSKKLPLCIYGEADFEINALLIPLHSRQSGYMMAEYMVNKGHRNIAFLSSPTELLTTARKNRMEGVIEYTKKAGIPLVIKTAEQEEDDLETGFHLADTLLQEHPRIDGIIAVNDAIAIGVLYALRSQNISVPSRVAVAGFDNIPFSNAFYPQLTTIDHSLQERTRIALSILLANEENKGQINISYPPVIIKRMSC